MGYTYSFGFNLAKSDTGLTLSAQLVDTDGASVGAAITTGFVEIGGGAYMLTCEVPDGHRGGIEVYDTAGPTLKAFGAINPEEAEVASKIQFTRNELVKGRWL